MTFKQKLALCWRILRQKKTDLLAHADRELPVPAGDEMQALMNQQLREVILVFCTHGHSGFSASYARNALAKLLDYKPLGPLTGEDKEWVAVSVGLWQNNRCGRVFKDSAGAYDSEGKVFRDSTGCYTNSNSRVYVSFPYEPSTEYVDVGETK